MAAGDWFLSSLDLPFVRVVGSGVRIVSLLLSKTKRVSGAEN